jgi:hypothetical protein
MRFRLHPTPPTAPKLKAGTGSSGQVAALLSGDQVESAIRIIRDVPPTQTEVMVINEAMTHFIEPGPELGVEIDASDINIPAPAVVLRPIAIYQ